jgi:hypothetical protein
MFIRVVTGIRSHFEQRFPEWLSAATISYWGLKLVGESDAWTNPQAWAGLLRLAPENAWGWSCMAIGTFWLVALAINGTFADTAYSKASPYVRGIAAMLSTVIWLQVFLSVNAVTTSGSGIYQLPLILGIWCVFIAWRDIGRVRVSPNGLAQ